ncbi:addiction module protein [Candidatus Sumerlaeota bacterium]|nr:addiction module protein [Candidatus Sumerlaeota bacterium]
MTTDTKRILKNALELPAKERIIIVDHLISSLDQPDEHIDSLWRKEVEDRVEAHQSGKIRSVPLEEVLSKYSKQWK